MPDQSPNLSLPFIMPAQSQKHVTHNEAIELLDMIATWRGGGWLFVAPAEGWRAWVRDPGAMYVRSATGWVAQSGAVSLDNVPTLGVNATADATNRLTVASDATLLNNDGAGHQVKINKASAVDTASLLYQTGFSGRVEMGLAGEDNLSIKVSDDGAAWDTAITIEADTARVQIGQVLQLAPAPEPASPAAGDLYFDSAIAKLRCYDGTVWRNLF